MHMVQPGLQGAQVPSGGSEDAMAGCMAASKFSQQLIEQKERELHESIAQNYSRIKDVERELRGLQMQVKLTAEPKKHALELLRSKIEAQNAKVSAVRRRYDAAKKAFEALQVELNQEDALKQQLCAEVNQLVSTSVSSQLESFEQLKARLEALQGGTSSTSSEAAAARAGSSAELAVTVEAVAAKHGAAAATAGCADNRTPQIAPKQQQQQQQPSVAGDQPQQQRVGCSPLRAAAKMPSSPTSSAAEAAAAAESQAGQQQAAAAVAAAAARAMAEAEAAAARSRHVQLPGRSKPGAGRTAVAAHAGAIAATRQQHSKQQVDGHVPQQQQQHDACPAVDRDGRFAGFEA